MKKKIVIIALAFVLCLSVIGGCFALYQTNATDLNITFGGEDAVTLTLTAAGGSLSFGGVKLLAHVGPNLFDGLNGIFSAYHRLSVTRLLLP